MNSFDFADVGREALATAFVVTLPILLVSLVTGIATGFFQAVTQIHDQSISFVPKLIAVLCAMALFGAWAVEYLVEYTVTVFSNPHFF